MNRFLPSWPALLFLSLSASASDSPISNPPQLKGFMRLGLVDSGDTRELRDASSRIGLHWQQNASTDWVVLATLELGFNITGSEPSFTFDGGDGFSPADSGDETFWPRLGFVGAHHSRWGRITAGKQWGSYYLVSGSTDMLEYFGGEASGTYNFRTDGGASGTGRADKAIQYLFQHGGLQLSLQHQAVESDIDLAALDLPTTVTARYGRGDGAAIRWRSSAGIGIGASWNQSEITLLDAGIPLFSTNDSATAATVFFGADDAPGLYAALVWYQGENHEIDDAGTVFDSTGGEYFLQWTFEEGAQIYVTGNRLTPQDDETRYELDYTAIGIRAPVLGPLLLFLEYKHEQSVTAAGAAVPDAVMLGAKYQF